MKEARQYRDQLRALLKEPRHAKDVETQAFAREVEKDVPGER